MCKVCSFTTFGAEWTTFKFHEALLISLSTALKEIMIFQRTLSILRFCRSGNGHKYSNLRHHLACSRSIAERAVAKAKRTATSAHATEPPIPAQDALDDDTIAAVVTGKLISLLESHSLLRCHSLAAHRLGPRARHGEGKHK